MQHECEVPPAQLATAFPLTIKDLLLSGAPETVSPYSVMLHEGLQDK